MSATKILICATDAGGARNLAPVVKLVPRDVRCKLIVSTDTMHFFGGATPKPEIGSINTLKQAKDYILSVQPKSILCGTTRYKSAERFLTAAGNELGVRTVAVLDEWFNYRHRFVDEKDNFVYLPDTICCQDEYAYHEAIEEGIPERILHITGSPALSDLTLRAEQFVNKEPKIPDYLSKDFVSPFITFISETHAADYSTNPDSHGPLGPFIGYTEISVRQSVLNVLGKLGFNVVFVEQLHPSAENNEPPRSVPINVDFRTVRKTDLWSLLWHSDLIIGMRSLALLEASILGCKAVSFQPGLIGPERCTAVRLGLVPKLEFEENLESWCTQQLAYTKKEQKRIIHRHPFAAPNAAERVIDLVLKKGVVCENWSDSSGPDEIGPASRKSS